MARKPKSDRQKIVERARKAVAGDPDKRVAWQSAWINFHDGALAEFLTARAKQRPAMAHYEAVHFTEAARAEMLRALLDGKSEDAATAAALDVISVSEAA